MLTSFTSRTIIAFTSEPFIFTQPHLAGLYDNLNEVQFNEKDYNLIVAVLSREKEKLQVGWYTIFKTISRKMMYKKLQYSAFNSLKTVLVTFA